MGFCYPGNGKSGDLPPRKECAPLWHSQLFGKINDGVLVLLIGKYAQDYYLKKQQRKLCLKQYLILVIIYQNTLYYRTRRQEIIFGRQKINGL